MNSTFRITNLGAQYKGWQSAYGRCFRLLYFQLGGGGVDDTGMPYRVDPTLTKLTSPITELLEIATYGTFSFPHPRKLTISITLPEDVGNGTFSVIGLFGEIIHCDESSDASLVGTQFLYGITNFTEVTKTSGEVKPLVISLNTAL